MRATALAALLSILTLPVLGQSDRGTMTGTVSDPAGAVIANAPIDVRNGENGASYQAGTSATGNYSIIVPAGTYEVSVTVPGFKRYVRPNIVVPVAQTLRIDIPLEVGSNSESVTVTEAAPLLKTESGELAHNVTSNTLNNLPVLGIGSANVGPSGIRSPYSVVNLLPGTAWLPDNSIRVNGLEGNSSAIRVEGQDATVTTAQRDTSQNQPSVEAVQEVAVQTSNYAAEFGQAGGGLFNFTMKSGTNQLHGSVYNYFVNEALNAGTPFTNDGKGNLLRPRQRRNDYGFSVGGPVWLPKLYDGHDRTFFFMNFEQFRETVVVNNFPITVPVASYRQGDFRQAQTGRNLGTDGLGRAIMENTIYNPETARLVNGVLYRDPYPNNTIPLQGMDPVAVRVQAFIPQTTRAGLINNYLPTYRNTRVSQIPSVKLDHSLSSTLKLSGYWARTQTDSPNNAGFEFPISNTVGSHVKSDTTRVNLDYTVTPTLLLHVGAGYLHSLSDPQVPRFSNASIGFRGVTADTFPFFSALNVAQGGVDNMGPPSNFRIENYKPSATISLTWVRNNHTYKFGGEMVINRYPTYSETYGPGNMVYSPTQTGDPSLRGVALPASVGFNYASFLLGSPNNGYLSVPATMQSSDKAVAGYVQDNWKVTRKLTLDIGLRYDFQTYLKERDGYMFTVSLSTPNPSAGNRPGGIILEGYGGGRCNCTFAHNYPFAFQPRLGAAYQINSKTVLRVGGGISYAKTGNYATQNNNGGAAKPFGPPEYGVPAWTLRGGIPYNLKFPDFNPGQQPLPGTVSNPTNWVDANAGRPAHIWQWSVGLQREVAKDLVVEASYVGNRGVWWPAITLSPWASNGIPISTLTANGLNLDNAADRTLLASPLDSALARSRGFGNAPYPGFPMGLTVAQALRPLAQYTTIVQSWNPLGNTWYDSLQAKATKRFSRGLDFVVTYTRSKSLTLGAEDNNNYSSPTNPVINDVFNRQNSKSLAGLDQPNQLVVAGNYTTPKLNANSLAGRALSWAVRDWTYVTVLRYASGIPFNTPAATTNLNALVFQTTRVNRVPGEPLFTQDLNCHCFDPNKEFVLNPRAWVNPALGRFGTAATRYADYRMQRRPSESMSIARNFRIKERASFMIRAEFSNIFNRPGWNVPTSANAFATQTRNAAGAPTGGFGFINPAAVGGNVTSPAAATAGTFATPLPRQGTLVARITF